MTVRGCKFAESLKKSFAVVLSFTIAFGLFSARSARGSNLPAQDDNQPPKKRAKLNSPLHSLLETTSLEIDKWNALPDEIWLEVFDHLRFSDLSYAALVCKHWGALTKDETLSLSKQILRKPLSVLLWKLENIEGGRASLKQGIAGHMRDEIARQAFFDSPDRFNKSLLEPSAIGYALRSAHLISALFESNIAASEIYQALHKEPLHIHKEQLESLEDYVKDAPAYPFMNEKDKNEEDENFIKFAKAYAPHYKALYFLSLYSLQNHPPFRRADETEAFYRRASNQERVNLPYCWLVFLTYQGNYQEAEPLLRREIESGNLDAQYLLGVVLENLCKVEEAEVFYRKAARQGHEKAQCSLGVLLLEDQNMIQEAQAFLRQSADQGHADAQFRLGRLLWEEKGKFKKAEAFLRQAAEQGHAEAQASLKAILKRRRGQGEEGS